MSTPRPRRAGETDEEYRAVLAELGKFNEKMYGDKTGPGQPPQPLMRGGKDNDRKIVRPLSKDIPPRPKITRNSQSSARQSDMGRSAVVMGLPDSVKGLFNQTTPNAAAPVKKAAGGAAKVRKGMMTSEGVITNAMNKVRGK